MEMNGCNSQMNQGALGNETQAEDLEVPVEIDREYRGNTRRESGRELN